MELTALLWVAAAAGALGGGHCLGMCGPLVVLFETPQTGATRFARLKRRALYNLGRLAFYVLLGTVAGGAGSVLTQVAGVDAGLMLLRAAAALLVFVMGLNLLVDANLLAPVERAGGAIWRRLSPLTRHVLPMSSAPRTLAAGFLWGALPCGLVYGAVALAATSGTAGSGALVMTAFFAGTLPALLAAGAAAHKLSRWSRQPWLRRPAGVLLCAVAVIAFALPQLHGPQHDGAQHARGDGIEDVAGHAH